MTLNVLCGFEPGADDPRIWANNTDSASTAGKSAPTTTTSSLSPSDARRWFKTDDTAGANTIFCRTNSFSPDTYVWYVQRDLVIEGTIPIGYAADYLQLLTDEAGGVGLALRIIRGSGTDRYTIQLRTDSAGGGTAIGNTSELTTETKYHIRIETNGTTWKLWVDGTLEIQGAWVYRIDDRGITLVRPTASSSVEHYWAGGSLSMSLSGTDRPGSDDAEVHDFEVDTGGSESEAGWGDDGDCTAGSTTAEIGDVALDGSDKVITSTFWCDQAGHEDSQTVDTVTKTFTSGHTIGGGYWRGVCAANVGGKTVASLARIYDGTSAESRGLANLGSTTFFSRHIYFPNAPAGGAWSQSEADGLKIGMLNGNGGNEANTECAAIVFTLVGLSHDPPVVARPVAHSGALGSASAGIY